MSTFDDGLIHAVAMSCRYHVYARLGEAALPHWDAVAEAAIRVHRRVEPSGCPQLVVFQLLEERPLPDGMPAGQPISGPAALEPQPEQELCIQVLASGRLAVWRGCDHDTVAMSEVAVVYELRAGVASVLANGERLPLTHPAYGPNGPFDPPSFADLDAGLDQYSIRMVRHSTCEILAQVWYDNDRCFLKAKPERYMRKSLTQFLRCNMRDDVEVKPEQNVDESKPVDIRVIWNRSNRRAIVELKWMGQSRRCDGTLATGWDAERALMGAKQLAGYLDLGMPHSPDHVTRGYLVVIDARRRGLTEDATQLAPEDAAHFRNVEVEYCPEYDKTRRDFATPRRMFAEPKAAWASSVQDSPHDLPVGSKDRTDDTAG